MSDLRRPLVTLVALAALCTMVGIFLFPGPSDQSQPPRASSSIDKLGSVTPQVAQAAQTPQTHPTTQQAPAIAVASRSPSAGSRAAGQGEQGGNASRPLTQNDPATTTTTAAPAVSTTTTAPALAAGGCAGGAPDVTTNPMTGQPWKCTFDDEFNGTSLDTSKWVPQQSSNSGFFSGDECYMNSPNNVSVSGGTLNLTARAESAPFLCAGTPLVTPYTSGMVSTYERFSQTYGLFEVRAKFPAVTVPGLQATLWLWPVNSKFYGAAWPASGEIDFAEWFSRYANLDIPNIHYLKANDATNHDFADCPLPNPSEFHTYGVVWTPTTLTILLDGATCMVDNWQPASPQGKPAPFDQPFIMSLTEALGIGNNTFNPSTTPLPATTQIDWVRVWS